MARVVLRCYDPCSLVPYMLKADGREGFITYDDASSTSYRVWYTDLLEAAF